MLTTATSVTRQTAPEQGKARAGLGGGGIPSDGTLTVTQPEAIGRRRWDAATRCRTLPLRPASPPDADTSGALRGFSPQDLRVGVGRGARVRESWVRWLAPHFADNDSCYFTGTYSDDYGFPHGLMLPRNVQADFRRFLDDAGYPDVEFVCAVEPHRYRAVLHLHAIIGGQLNESDRLFLKLLWQIERGWAKSLPVKDGCESYVTKYALKSTVEAFDFHLEGR